MVCWCTVIPIAVAGIATLTALVFYYIAYVEKKREEEFAKRGLKYVSLPNLIWMQLRGQHMERVQLQEIKENGTVFGTTIFMTKAILIAEPELIQIVLSKEFANFTDRREFKFAQDELSNSFLSVAQGEQWKRIRSVVTPTFATGKLRQMQPRIDMALETLVENIRGAVKEQNGTDIDIKRLLGGFTMNTLIQVAYGLKVDSLNDDHPIIIHAKKAFESLRFKNLVIFFFMLSTPRLAKFLNLRVNGSVTDFFREFSSKIIDQRKKDLAEMTAKGEPFKANNFLDFMIESENELKSKNSEDEMKHKYISKLEMISQCVLFFLAGYETTASALTLTIYNLIVNPDIQERVYNEIQDVISQLESENAQNTEDTRKGLELINLDNLSRFELTGAVFDESIRIYAPANFLERTAHDDITIETADKKIKVEIHKGDLIHIPVYATHRDTRYWNDPEKFDPDRFLGERKMEHHKYSYLPFGAGPRGCVAKTFAIMEARFALIHMIYNFRFSVGPKTSIPPKFLKQGGLATPKECFTNIEQRIH